MVRTDRSQGPDLLIAAASAAATFAVFFPVTSASWVLYDDDLDIYENPFLSLTWAGLKWMFTDASYRGRYMPLSWLSWAANWQASPTPAAFHTVDLLLHCANAALLYLVLRSLFDKLARWCAAAGALLWALHPLRVEAVALASNRTYEQALFFLLVSALLWLSARPRLSALAYLLSTLTFPLAPLYPFVLALRDRALKGKELLLGVSALAVLTALAKPAGAGLPPVARSAVHAGYALAHSLWRPLAPVNLRPVYPDLYELGPAAPAALAGFAAAGLLAWLAWSLRKRAPVFSALVAAHFLLLAPFTGALDARPLVCADRYSAVYGLALAAAAAWALAALAKRTKEGAALSAAGLLVALAVGSRAQLPVWRDGVALWTFLETQDLGPARPRALWKLAFCLWREGRSGEALQALTRLEAEGPLSAPALTLRAAILADLGSPRAARVDVAAAQRLPLNPTTAYDVQRVAKESARRDAGRED